MKLLLYIKMFFNFVLELYKSRKLLWQLAIADYKKRYVGNYLGILWAFIQPTVTILVLWFVFQMGFKSGSIDNFPFILWLISGLIPWFFISEAVINSTNSIIINSFLVKKMVFKVSLLPLIQILTSFFTHLVFIGFMLLIFLVYKKLPNLYWMQIPYYIFATIFFVLSVSWFTSSIAVFFRDLSQIIGVILQFGFWLTPIFWTPKNLPEFLKTIIKINPIYYIVQGYRDSLIYHNWFWQNWKWALYFWISNSLVFIIGAMVFRKLKSHFADVL